MKTKKFHSLKVFTILGLLVGIILISLPATNGCSCLSLKKKYSQDESEDISVPLK